MDIRYKPRAGTLTLAVGGLLFWVASASAEGPVAGSFPAISPVMGSDGTPVRAVHDEPAKPDQQSHRLVCWPFHKKSAPVCPEQPAKEKVPAKLPEKEPDKKVDQPPQVPVFQPEQAAAGGGDTFAYNPQMLGEFIGPIGTRLFQAGLFAGGSITPTNAYVTAPILSQSSFKIAENESPRPVDRVFGCYNYYNSVAVSVQNVSATSLAFPIDHVHIDVHRETFGFEKTFLDGDASIGLRVPVAQAAGSFRTFPFGISTINLVGDLGDSDSGDLSFIFKYALINNRATGNLLSCGLVITLPTGDDFIGFAGEDLHPVLIQPWLGWIYNSGNMYLQGFNSLVVPTDSLEPTFLANDLGIGYWLVRNNRGRAIRSIVPTMEAHLTTPLNHGGDNELVTVANQLVFTGGVHLQLDERVWLTIGVGAPVTGPHEYAMETIVQLNWRF